MKFEPLIGSPPMPTHVDWPMPASVSASTTSYVSVPERLTDADVAGAVDVARDDAHLGLAQRSWRPGSWGRPGARRPASTTCTTRSMSSAGMCSVMQKTVLMPASTASRMASGAPAAGT